MLNIKLIKYAISLFQYIVYYGIEINCKDNKLRN